MSIDIQKELLDWLKSAAEASGSVAAREIPAYAEELVSWYFWSSIVAMGVTLTLMVVSGFVASVLLRKWFALGPEQMWQDSTAPLAIPGVALTVFSIAMFFVTSEKVYYAVKATVAPRVVVVEGLTESLRR